MTPHRSPRLETYTAEDGHKLTHAKPIPAMFVTCVDIPRRSSPTASEQKTILWWCRLFRPRSSLAHPIGSRCLLQRSSSCAAQANWLVVRAALSAPPSLVMDQPTCVRDALQRIATQHQQLASQHKWFLAEASGTIMQAMEQENDNLRQELAKMRGLSETQQTPAKRLGDNVECNAATLPPTQPPPPTWLPQIPQEEDMGLADLRSAAEQLAQDPALVQVPGMLMRNDEDWSSSGMLTKRSTRAGFVQGRSFLAPTSSSSPDKARAAEQRRLRAIFSIGAEETEVTATDVVQFLRLRGFEPDVSLAKAEVMIRELKVAHARLVFSDFDKSGDLSEDSIELDDLVDIISLPVIGSAWISCSTWRKGRSCSSPCRP